MIYLENTLFASCTKETTRATGFFPSTRSREPLTSIRRELEAETVDRKGVPFEAPNTGPFSPGPACLFCLLSLCLLMLYSRFVEAFIFSLTTLRNWDHSCISLSTTVTSSSPWFSPRIKPAPKDISLSSKQIDPERHSAVVGSEPASDRPIRPMATSSILVRRAGNSCSRTTPELQTRTMTFLEMSSARRLSPVSV